MQTTKNICRNNFFIQVMLIFSRTKKLSNPDNELQSAETEVQSNFTKDYFEFLVTPKYRADLNEDNSFIYLLKVEMTFNVRNNNEVQSEFI
jgi:hypothetical protein